MNGYPGPPGHPAWVDNANGTVSLCARKCLTWHGSERCVAFETNIPDGNRSMAACYVFLGTVKQPFTPLDSTAPSKVTTCVVDGFKPPSPPPPPQRGKTSGHSFPRLSNCWGSDPYITDEMWDYVGFPNMTNETWVSLAPSLHTWPDAHHLPVKCCHSSTAAVTAFPVVVSTISLGTNAKTALFDNVHNNS
eukprot:SAG31_NODE_3602_length_4080_cov_6.988194_4_plen_191_part_00